MLLDSPADGDLLANLRTGRAGQLEFGHVGLDTQDLGAGSGRSDVHHEDLVLGQLGDLGLLAVGRLDTQQAAQQEVVDLELGVDGGQAAAVAQDETDETVGTAQRGVDAGSDTDQTTGHGELEIVVLRKERDDPRVDGAALDLAVLILSDQTGTDLDLVVQLQHTRQDRATGHTALELLDLRTGLVDVEGPDDDHVGMGGEVADGDGDVGDDVLVDGIDVVLELGGDGDDGGAVGHGTPDELQYRLVVLQSGVFPHQVDLVLQDDDVAKLHDLDGSQVLRGLRLRAAFVTGDQEQRSVHDGGTRQHGAHENVVSGAVDEPVPCESAKNCSCPYNITPGVLTRRVSVVCIVPCIPLAHMAGRSPSRSCSSCSTSAEGTRGCRTCRSWRWRSPA